MIPESPGAGGLAMEAILEMVQNLIQKFFGKSAVPVIQAVVAQILAFVGSIFSRLAPARA
jgi:hypothetical protein